MEVPALIWLIALVRFSGRERGWRLAPTLGLWCRRLTPLLHCQALWLRGNRRKWEKGESRTSEEENHYFSNGQSPYLLIFVRAHTLFSLRHGMHTEKKKEKKKRMKKRWNWWPRNKEWSWLLCKLQSPDKIIWTHWFYTDEFWQSPNQLLHAELYYWTEFQKCGLWEMKFLPMVQFAVIFLRLGLCRSNSSSRFVGSHIEYFSPIPDVLENWHIIFHANQAINTCKTFF